MSQPLHTALVQWLPRSGWFAAALLGGVLFILCLFELWYGFTAGRPPSIQQTPAGDSVAADPVDQIIQAHLFGRSAGGPPTLASNNRQLPETSLQLTLRGAFAGTSPDQGSALIETADGRTRSYRVGTHLDSSIVLQEVYSDYVVLERSGQLESLYFPEPGATAAAAAANSGSAATGDYQLPEEVSALARNGVSGAAIRRQVDQLPQQAPADPEERRQMIRRRLEELRQRAAQNRDNP